MYTSNTFFRISSDSFFSNFSALRINLWNKVQILNLLILFEHLLIVNSIIKSDLCINQLSLTRVLVWSFIILGLLIDCWFESVLWFFLLFYLSLFLTCFSISIVSLYSRPLKQSFSIIKTDVENRIWFDFINRLFLLLL